jgi:hypothetical protein
MGKLIDFYKKAESDGKLRADLEAANGRLEKQKNISRETVVAEVIKIAAEYGTSLEPADFEAEQCELDELELEAAAGGKVSVCVTPGDDPFGRGRKNGMWPDEPSKLPPLCTAYGNNPHPVFGITFKIN